MNKTILGIAAASAAYFLIFRFAIKVSEDDPTGFVPLSEGFGLDDVILGAGPFLAARMIMKAG